MGSSTQALGQGRSVYLLSQFMCAPVGQAAQPGRSGNAGRLVCVPAPTTCIADPVALRAVVVCLQQVRVVQRNLVYAVGMPLSMCREEVSSTQQQQLLEATDQQGAAAAAAPVWVIGLNAGSVGCIDTAATHSCGATPALHCCVTPCSLTTPPPKLPVCAQVLSDRNHFGAFGRIKKVRAAL